MKRPVVNAQLTTDLGDNAIVHDAGVIPRLQLLHGLRLKGDLLAADGHAGNTFHLGHQLGDRLTLVDHRQAAHLFVVDAVTLVMVGKLVR